MPANLPPEYFEVERKYRKAKTIKEKIIILRQLLSVVPKHKGTEKLQAEIKSKIARLRREQEEEKRTGRRSYTLYIPTQGAAQVVVIGPPNTGKSSLLSRLTSAKPLVAPYPFTTTQPVAGMMNYQDIQIQLVDTSPITANHIDSWVIDLIRNADLIILVGGLDAPEPEESIEPVFRQLEKRSISLVGSGLSDSYLFGPTSKRVMFIINKVDLPNAHDALKRITSRYSKRFPIISTSCLKGTGIEILPSKIFSELEIIRVYTKPPGRPPVMENPIVLRKGETVLDAAKELHKDFAKNLKYAKLWGPSAKFPGQRVERTHTLQDGDIIELHI